MTITRSLSLAVAFACAAPRLALTQQQFTLEQVLGAPFASDLVAAHRGNSVAWIVNHRGARNVWVAAGPSWQPRQVTRYQDDDGQEIESLTFTPDGRSVVYVRGGPPNGAGDRPNPALIRGGVDQAIWIASVDQGTPRKIADGSSPELSPSADSLAFDMSLDLGLPAKETALLALTLFVSGMTLAQGRATVLQGAVHLVLFAVFLFLAIVP